MTNYDILKIADGVVEIVDQQRDAGIAQQHAIAQSRIVDAVFAVQRQGFGDPLYFVWRGAIHSSLETIRRISMPNVPPVLVLEPPKPEVESTPIAAPKPEAETEQVVPDEKPEGSTGSTRPPKKSRPRARKQPEETKLATEAEQPEGSLGPEPHIMNPPKSTETKKRIHKASETKAMPGAIISADDETGIVRAVVSVFGIVDDGDDIIHPGAFTKTIVEHGSRIRVLNSHNNRDGLNVIGKALAMREVGRNELPLEILNAHPEATGGLETETQFLINTPEGRGIYDRIKAGALNEWSIGFDAVDTDNSRMKRKSAADPVWEMAIKTDDYDPDSDPLTLKDKNGKPRIVRNIRAVRLWEYSSVIWGMNESTTTVSVKEKDGEVTSGSDTYGTPAVDVMYHSNRDEPERLTKAGRVLNERNFQAITQAADLLNTVLASAGLNDGDAAEDADKSRQDSEDDNATDGPSVSTNAPTPSTEGGAGPQDDDTPATKQADLLKQLEERLAED